MPVKSSQKTSSLISPSKLLALYAALLRCRAVAEAAGPGRAATHEAAAVAVIMGLRPADTLISVTRDAVPHLVTGAPLGHSLQEGPATARAPSAAQLKSAVAAARAHKSDGKGRVAAVFCGRASISSLAMRTARRAAVTERLPIIFVHQADADLATPAAGKCELGLPVIASDRDDPVALYRVASEAIAHARRGNGPTLIECAPWRLASAKEGAASGSLANMERYLARAGISGARHKARVMAGFKRELRESAALAGKNAPARVVE